MKVGMIGCGKLGLPVILAIENKGHQVMGSDVDPRVKEYVRSRTIPYVEAGTPELLKKTKVRINSVQKVVEFADIIFVAIQTPHKEMYEGITRLPKTREDFDYSYLVAGMKEIAEVCRHAKKRKIVVVISTVLPGTMEREIKSLLNEFMDFCYNPFFIAMGTVRKDFENPEFVLLGSDNGWVINKMTEFYKTIHDKPVFATSVINAELIKVVYNTYISSKIAFINTIMEICEKVGADVDAVSDALSLATDRVISMRYLRGGMGDGGGCHPRDGIALSWLARKLDLSYDYFGEMMLAREKQTEWLAKLVADKAKETGLPVVICGVSFKKNTNLTIGSPVRLLENILDEMGVAYTAYDPIVYPGQQFPNIKAIYFIGMNHDIEMEFPQGSVVIDPWNYIGRTHER
jgi:UDPglucose 6-dehydrogenase